MLKPSIDELLNEIHSRFALTIVIAKRARQLQLNPDDYKVDEAVGRDNNEVAKALEELNAEKLDYYLTPESAAMAKTKELSFESTFEHTVDAVVQDTPETEVEAQPIEEAE